MYFLKKTVSVGDTDLSGRIFFTFTQKISCEAFEFFLSEQGFSLKEMFLAYPFSLAIRHIEANYYDALSLGDKVNVELCVLKIGQTSFTLKSIIKETFSEKVVADVTIVQVVIDKQEMTPKMIPADLRKALSSILVFE